MIIEPKLGPTWEEEDEVTEAPGGRSHTILTLLSGGQYTTGELTRLTRNLKLNARIDKARLWATLKSLQGNDLIIRKGGPAMITPKGLQALTDWNKKWQ